MKLKRQGSTLVGAEDVLPILNLLAELQKFVLNVICLEGTMEKNERVKLGKRSRAAGKRFELRVRAKLEEEGWVVAKWTNNVSEPFEQDIGEWVRKLVPAKSKYNPFLKRVINEGSGFPDFIIFKPGIETENEGVEAKFGKYLDAEEKEKIKWLLEKQIFSKIRVAYPSKNRRNIEYDEFVNEKK